MLITYCSTTFYIILMIFKIEPKKILENLLTEIHIDIFVQMQIWYVIMNSTSMAKLSI